DVKNDFGLWKIRMQNLLEQHGLAAALKELPKTAIVAYDNQGSKRRAIAAP
ncbi:hypothetical protein Tco_0249320, partial [Tanacetum coccineum]